MTAPLVRVVFDTVTLLQAGAKPRGPAGACLRLVIEENVTLVMSVDGLHELRLAPSCCLLPRQMQTAQPIRPVSRARVGRTQGVEIGRLAVLVVRVETLQEMLDPHRILLMIHQYAADIELRLVGDTAATEGAEVGIRHVWS